MFAKAEVQQSQNAYQTQHKCKRLMTTDIFAIFRIWIFQFSFSKMDEVLSEVHVHNKFDLIPNDNIASKSIFGI